MSNFFIILRLYCIRLKIVVVLTLEFYVCIHIVNLDIYTTRVLIIVYIQ
jgi:hypothetical protein